MNNNEVFSGYEPQHNQAEQNPDDGFALHQMLDPEEFEELLTNHKITPEFMSGLFMQRHSLEELLKSVN
jgi:hypothetical protein